MKKGMLFLSLFVPLVCGAYSEKIRGFSLEEKSEELPVIRLVLQALEGRLFAPTPVLKEACHIRRGVLNGASLEAYEEAFSDQTPWGAQVGLDYRGRTLPYLGGMDFDFTRGEKEEEILRSQVFKNAVQWFYDPSEEEQETAFDLAFKSLGVENVFPSDIDVEEQLRQSVGIILKESPGLGGGIGFNQMSPFPVLPEIQSQTRGVLEKFNELSPQFHSVTPQTEVKDGFERVKQVKEDEPFDSMVQELVVAMSIREDLLKEASLEALKAMGLYEEVKELKPESLSEYMTPPLKALFSIRVTRFLLGRGVLKKDPLLAVREFLSGEGDIHGALYPASLDPRKKEISFILHRGILMGISFEAGRELFRDFISQQVSQSFSGERSKTAQAIGRALVTIEKKLLDDDIFTPGDEFNQTDIDIKTNVLLGASFEAGRGIYHQGGHLSLKDVEEALPPLSSHESFTGKVKHPVNLCSQAGKLYTQLIALDPSAVGMAVTYQEQGLSPYEKETLSEVSFEAGRKLYYLDIKESEWISNEVASGWGKFAGIAFTVGMALLGQHQRSEDEKKAEERERRAEERHRELLDAIERRDNNQPRPVSGQCLEGQAPELCYPQ